MLLNITGGRDLGLFEVNEAAEIISTASAADSNIIFGAVVDEGMGDEVRVTVIATGFDSSRRDRAPAAPHAAARRERPGPRRQPRRSRPLGARDLGRRDRHPAVPALATAPLRLLRRQPPRQARGAAQAAQAHGHGRHDDVLGERRRHPEGKLTPTRAGNALLRAHKRLRVGVTLTDASAGQRTTAKATVVRVTKKRKRHSR